MRATRTWSRTLPAPATLPLLLACTTAFEAVERIRRALAGEFAVLRVARLAEARAALAEWAPTGRLAGLVLEPEDADARITACLVPEWRRWLAGAPSSVESRGVGDRDVTCGAPPVLALMRRSVPWRPSAIALVEASPAAVLLVEDVDLGAVQRALRTRLRRAEVVRAVWGGIASDVPSGLRPLVRAALAQAEAPPTVRSLAAALGIHRKTVWSRCRRHGVPNAQALLTWCRLLTAAEVLRQESRPVEQVAEELAFASATALRNAVRRHLATTPTALRDGDGGAWARARFVAWLRGAVSDVVRRAADGAAPPRGARGSRRPLPPGHALARDAGAPRAVRLGDVA